MAAADASRSARLLTAGGLEDADTGHGFRSEAPARFVELVDELTARAAP